MTAIIRVSKYSEKDSISEGVSPTTEEEKEDFEKKCLKKIIKFLNERIENLENELTKERNARIQAEHGVKILEEYILEGDA